MKSLILVLLITACTPNNTPTSVDATPMASTRCEPDRPEPLLLRPDQAALWNYAGGPVSPVIDCRAGSNQMYCKECGGQGGPCCNTQACVIECDDYCKARKTSCCAPL